MSHQAIDKGHCGDQSIASLLLRDGKKTGFAKPNDRSANAMHDSIVAK